MPEQVIEIVPDRSHLYGATLAQEHLSRVLPALNSLNRESTIFMLNLSDVTSITGSYLRATVQWAFLCGQAEVQGTAKSSHLDPWAIRPLPLFPAVIGGSPEVIDEVHDFFRARSLPLFHITKRTKSSLKTARLLGNLDTFLASTLLSLAKLREASAADLAENSDENITVNAWSNRLADLYLLRLVTRSRSGKFWRYSPLAEEITLWD
jgi:hypothetical protein